MKSLMELNKNNKYEIEMREGFVCWYEGKSPRLTGYVPSHGKISIPEGYWGLITTSPIIKIWEDKYFYYETMNTVYWSKEKFIEVPGVPTDLTDFKSFLPKTSSEILELLNLDTETYSKLCLQTESIDFVKIKERLSNDLVMKQLEFLLDQQMRLGNSLDALKKHIFYGKDFKPISIIGFEFDTNETLKKFDNENLIRTLHAVMGVATEAPEMIESLYKHLFENQNFDSVNMAEEAGDVMWYLAILCNASEADLNSVMKKNIAKLFKRYKDGKFTEQSALNRDLTSERKILES